jgi:hypothetical protein
MAYNTSWLTGAWYRGGAALARHRLAWRRPGYRHEVQRWLVLQAGANPSTDYYIRPRAARAGVATVYRDIDTEAPSAADFQPGTQVVVVRYLDRRWADALHTHATALAGVVYFMDDDLLNPSTWRQLPEPYHDKLARHFATVGSDIGVLASRVWVSTPELQARYPDARAEVMPPLPLVDDVPSPQLTSDFVRIFYHGTKAHEAEIRWLRPVIAACLDGCPHAHFEIIGDHEVNKAYRGLPRTRVLHPMSWPNYLDHCRSMQGHIGLAPLFESDFNAGRSHTKVLDIARCGATGIYTRSPTYDAAVRDGVDGVLLPNEPNTWTQRIVALASDKTTLARMQRNAAERHLLAHDSERTELQHTANC